ncbi:(LipO)protein [Seminavis robusta]|uniref:(LipO)protein n=1 Tax=Seminavis robusta TaxID=568900 RepID=A0A9N8H273_9STRA|nr:(LipO)protein [Seminavis robusta]|eukprot:Sro31_g019980.1 (LipO)protein (253) ;mRNA; f:2518-3276
MTLHRFYLLLIASSVSSSLPPGVHSQAVRGKASMAVEVDDATMNMVQYELDDPKCFETTDELRDAVAQYKSSKQFDPELASKYGWPIGQWCVSNIADFSNLFVKHRYFDEPLDRWDMSQATDLSGMFQNCHWFNHPLNDWDVSSVTSTSRLFASARAFNQPLDHWKTDRVRDMSYMFLHAFSFDQNIQSWNIGAVKNMEGMFRDARSFDDANLQWDVSRVENTKMMVSSIPGVSLNLRGAPQQQTVIATMNG